MPAKAGIQNCLKILDSRLRGNDVKGRNKTFYDTINFQISIEKKPVLPSVVSEKASILVLLLYNIIPEVDGIKQRYMISKYCRNEPCKSIFLS